MNLWVVQSQIPGTDSIDSNESKHYAHVTNHIWMILAFTPLMFNHKVHEPLDLSISQTHLLFFCVILSSAFHIQLFCRHKNLYLDFILIVSP